MNSDYDVAIVGAGILGLAHAYHCACRGMRVLVLERGRRAQGASVRNFGMVWPIGQPRGPAFQLALRSRAIWLEVLAESELWHASVGSIHLAHHDDEASVLNEFVATAAVPQAALLTPREIASRFPAIVQSQLRCGMFSPWEVTVDPRQVIAELPAWLHRRFSVDFAFGSQVLSYDAPHLKTVEGVCRSPRLLVCTGVDFRELVPQAFADSGLTPCKLQMMRTQAFGNSFRLGTMLAAGLTLRHYRSFAECPTLPALIARLDRDYSEYGQFGIHVMAAQNGLGEIVIGDSHEYGADIDPFDKPALDELILRYLRTMVDIPQMRIAARWHGIYLKHPTKPFLIADPQPGMRVVNGVGGAGMTLSFGLAEQALDTWNLIGD